MKASCVQSSAGRDRASCADMNPYTRPEYSRYRRSKREVAAAGALDQRPLPAYFSTRTCYCRHHAAVRSPALPAFKARRALKERAACCASRTS